jgi:ABC-type transport system substrate-binding protein
MQTLAIFLLGLLLSVPCGVVSAPLAYAADNDTVTIALTGEPPTMDPHRVSNFIGAMVWRWSYDTLVTAETGTGEHKPWLATKWESQDNNKTVKFWLRQDATFSDGTPVTSESIKFAMQRVL